MGLPDIDSSTRLNQGDAPQRGPILIVEDNPHFSRIWETRLQRAGFEVLLATDGKAGLEAARTANPELILTDWMMPRMDGVTMVKNLRQSRHLQTTYVILFTQKTDVVERVQGLESGADDYLSKDADPEEVMARIRAGMRIRSLQTALLLQARVDGLTALLNRSFFYERLEDEICRARRYGEDLTLAMIDLNDFKAINDTHGHLAGDAAIRHTAAMIKSSCRDSDLVCRYGGDEFAILFVNADSAHAEVVMQRIVKSLRQDVFVYRETPLTVSLSFGLANPKCTDLPEPDEFIAEADRQLYEMKNRLKSVTR